MIPTMPASDDVTSQIISLTQMHVAIATPAILASLVLAVPLARIALAHPIGGYLLLQGTSLLFAIPALPLLVAIPAVLDTSPTSPLVLIVLLTMYGVAVMARQTSGAFAAMPESVADRARELGYGPIARFVRLELPCVWGDIVRVLRLVCASTLSMSVGAIVGIPGLGLFITRGYAEHDTASIVIGVVATIVLALVLDALVAAVGRAIARRLPGTTSGTTSEATPWTTS